MKERSAAALRRLAGGMVGIVPSDVHLLTNDYLHNRNIYCNNRDSK